MSHSYRAYIQEKSYTLAINLKSNFAVSYSMKYKT